MKVIFKQLGEERSGHNQQGQPWNVKQIVANTVGDYPNLIVFDVFNDKVNTLSLIPGNEYEISFNVKSREYQNKYYTSLTAWKIESAGVTEKSGLDNDESGMPF